MLVGTLISSRVSTPNAQPNYTENSLVHIAAPYTHRSQRFLANYTVTCISAEPLSYPRPRSIGLYKLLQCIRRPSIYHYILIRHLKSAAV